MTLYVGDNPFAEYIEALARLEVQIKLVSYHTLEAARQAEKAADFTMLTAYFAKEAMK